MDQGAQDMSAQLAKLKASDSDTIMVTSAVDQLVLLFKQMAALGLKKRVINHGRLQNPDQIIAQAGRPPTARCISPPFLPWIPEKTRTRGDRDLHRGVEAARYEFAGVTESFRGYDGIRRSPTPSSGPEA